MNATLEIPDHVVEMPKPKTAKLPTLPKKKILLVDDDSGIRQILMPLLEDEGYCVLSAFNGILALQFAAVFEFDLVLLDLNLPNEDGWEIFERLTADHPFVPVIVITAQPNQLFTAMAAGAGALLEKPLNFKKLSETTRTLLEEPPELRLARLTGQSSTFNYIPSKELANR